MVPLIMGAWATCLLRAGMAFLYVTFGCVLSVGFWAKLLITNAPLGAKEAVAETAI